MEEKYCTGWNSLKRYAVSSIRWTQVDLPWILTADRVCSASCGNPAVVLAENFKFY
jgi:hypothetical protein